MTRSPISIAEGKHRVEAFRRYYGEQALKLAYHGAFPLTLTSDLLHCLRENFVPDVPWYVVGDVLLSELCCWVGPGLYEMESNTRRALLDVLKKDLGEQARDRVFSIEQFMLFYLQQHIDSKSRHISRMIGDKTSFRWMALFPFREEHEIVAIINQYLKNLAIEPKDREERFWMARMIRKQSDWLMDEGFRVTVLDWSDHIIESGTILSDIASTEITTDQPKPEEDELYPFEFEVVTVNERGDEVSQTRRKAFRFLEPLGKGTALEMVAIPGGQFEMGSPIDAKGDIPSEKPQHTVTIAPFFIARTTITQFQWKFVSELEPVDRKLNPTPYRAQGDNLPVENVTWYDAVEFCERLSVYTGRHYRLPTEAEWEYACRAGTTTPFHFGATITTELANFFGLETYSQEPRGIYRQQTTSVGSFPANAFGLNDMHGNVWEWCLDHWHDRYDNAPTDGTAWLTEKDTSHRVLRGGSWTCPPKQCYSAYRLRSVPDRYNHFGLRVVCVAPESGVST